jgi:hypothetical protein
MGKVAFPSACTAIPCSSHQRMANHADLSGVSTSGSSIGARGADRILRMRIHPFEGTEQQCAHLLRLELAATGRVGDPVLRATPTARQVPRLCVVHSDCESDAAEGAPDRRRVREARSTCLRHECQRQAARQNVGASSVRILRDCTRGSHVGARRRVTKIQSDPHGDMRS